MPPPPSSAAPPLEAPVSPSPQRKATAKKKVQLAACFFGLLTAYASSNLWLSLRTTAIATTSTAGANSSSYLDAAVDQFLLAYLQPPPPPPLPSKRRQRGRVPPDLPVVDKEGSSLPEKMRQEDATTSQEAFSAPKNKSLSSLPSLSSSSLAGLSCEAWGGPSRSEAREMVYWKDNPGDSRHVSPLKHPQQTQYLTFEADHGGFNNIRMAFETTLALAVAMGRTLVLPPEQPMYLLEKKKHDKHQRKQRSSFSFQHFFDLEAIRNEHAGVDIISMQEFLEKEAMAGKIRHPSNPQQHAFPPRNRTDWNDQPPGPLFQWLRNTFHTVVWIPEECLAAFPAIKDDDSSLQDLVQMNRTIRSENPPVRFESFVGKPVPVDAPALHRLKENWAGRTNLCLYDRDLQSRPVLHFPVGRNLARGGDGTTVEARLLVHFYAMLFFQDWRQDLWMKRFVRDHVRFVDEIQCAAARVVSAIRRRVREKSGLVTGTFDTMHVRRGDFQYKLTRVTANDIYLQASKKLPENGTVFIATDERDKSFFEPLRTHYDIVFLDDFHDALGPDLNSNYFGTYVSFSRTGVVASKFPGGGYFHSMYR
jgi:hypothetical protein